MDSLRSRIYNVGGPEPLQLHQIAEIASRVAQGPVPVHRPFPEERKSIDIGSYVTDSSRIRRELDWHPRVRFEDGIARAIGYYHRELRHYVDRGVRQPVCRLDGEPGPRKRRLRAVV